MSKIIDALEKVRAVSHKSTETESPPLRSRDGKAASFQTTQKELADVYFAGGGKAKRLPNPTLIRVMEKKRSFLWPWVFTTAVLILVSLTLLLNERIAIDINTSGTKPSLGAGLDRASNVLGASMDVIELSSGDFLFSPGAAGQSSSNDEGLILVNPAQEGQVYAYLTFAFPFNAADYTFEFQARGETGNETLEVVFKDWNHQSSLNWKPLIPFPMGLSTEWQKAEISIDRSEAFDAQRVAQMRLEIGAQRTGNPEGSVVFIKNLRWKPKGKG